MGLGHDSCHIHAILRLFRGRDHWVSWKKVWTSGKFPGLFFSTNNFNVSIMSPVVCDGSFQLGKWGYPFMAGWFMVENPIYLHAWFLAVPPFFRAGNLHTVSWSPYEFIHMSFPMVPTSFPEKKRHPSSRRLTKASGHFGRTPWDGPAGYQQLGKWLINAGWMLVLTLVECWFGAGKWLLVECWFDGRWLIVCCCNWLVGGCLSLRWDLLKNMVRNHPQLKHAENPLQHLYHPRRLNIGLRKHLEDPWYGKAIDVDIRRAKNRQTSISSIPAATANSEDSIK